MYFSPKSFLVLFLLYVRLEIIYFAVQMNPEGIGLKVRFSLWH